MILTMAEEKGFCACSGQADGYVELAKAAILAFTEKGTVLKMPESLTEQLRKSRAAVFVSIKKNGRLRGCIGTIFPCCDCVAEEVIQNAISACSRDPRFPPVCMEEIPMLSVSVDVLAEPEPIASIEELEPSRFGVIVSCGHRRGLLLPDLEGVDSAADQVMIAMQKGGIGPHEAYRLERFEVIRHNAGANQWPSAFDGAEC